MIEVTLKNLVDHIDGATGAIIVAADGEAVEWGLSEQSDRLRLRSAYIALVMQTFRRAAGRARLGRLGHMVIEYQGATLIAQEIDDDCSVMVELKPNASVSAALFRMQAAVKLLRDEFKA